MKVLDKTQAALLTRTEIEWLQHRIELSGGYQRKIKSDIRKKLRIFNELEPPLLVKSGFMTATPNCNNVSINCDVNCSLIDQSKEIHGQNGSLGRDLDPGPLPYQGNALPG
jgi:hypothetical protein